MIEATLEAPEFVGPCSDCHRAALAEWHGFTYGCPQCAARAAARSRQARDVRLTGRMTREFHEVCHVYRVTPDQVRDAARFDKLPPPKPRNEHAK